MQLSIPPSSAPASFRNLIAPVGLQGMTPFTFDNIKFKVGPFNLGPFNIPEQGKDGKLPFFKILYVDDDILCAVGKSGGIALWSKADKTFEMEKGLNL